MILESYKCVEDLRKLSIPELESFSEEVREYIIDVISKNGGHLASSLGVVELTIALHYVFNTPRDKIIWDVGHQAYCHKILTDRKEDFCTIRKYKGLSGFPKRNESLHDVYDVGHSSTSLSLLIGEATGRDLKGEDYKVAAVIGDGSLTAGMAYEALNQIGHSKTDVIIILNDNEHSISRNVGAISQYLTRIISGHLYNRFRRKTMNLIRKIPVIGEGIFNFIYTIALSFKGLIIPGRLFQDMGVRYFGPVDGHNMRQLIDVIENVRDIDTGPKIVHVITKKGKGYLPAEMEPDRFHGIGPFDQKTGLKKNSSETLTYSEIAGKTLKALGKQDKTIVAVTAAMKLGTGLSDFEKSFPRRFFDVGIAEQHAMTFSASLASTGMKPFVAIYSTFMQRAIDQIIHDIALMNLPVKILVDRAGIVGDDGETHHGVFDIPLLRPVPGITLLSPSSGRELRDMVCLAASYDKGPIIIRFPRGSVSGEDIEFSKCSPYTISKMKIYGKGKDVAVFVTGDMYQTGLEVYKKLAQMGIGGRIIDVTTIKPFNHKKAEKIISDTEYFISVENGVLSGGFGELIVSSLPGHLMKKYLFSAGFPDQFIHHGSRDELFREFGLDPESISQRIASSFSKKKI